MTRFMLSLVGIYVYHFLWDSIFITPMVYYFYRRKQVEKSNIEKMRESLWKSVSVASLFALGINTPGTFPWWKDSKYYFEGWPYQMSEGLLWYYMLYSAFWVQSVDFVLSITKTYYNFKRKDSVEMLTHHFVVMALMLFAYLFDLIGLGSCVLMLHDVNDLILEIGKVCVYVGMEIIPNILFVFFATSWYILRWGFYTENVLLSSYSDGYYSILAVMSKSDGNYHHYKDSWYWIWLAFILQLTLLLLLHIYWGVLIFKMVIRTLTAGKIGKDIRSDSESEDDQNLLDSNNPECLDSSSKSCANGRLKGHKSD